MTVSSGCPHEGELEALRAKVEEKENDYRQELMPLLTGLSPASSAEAIEQVAQRIAQAITRFRLDLETQGRESVKAQRKELRKQKAALEACYVAIDDGAQSIMARVAFNVALLKTPGSRRELKKQLICAIKAAEIALAGLDGPPHEGAWHIAALSSELALRMRDLGLRPTASSDDMYARPRPGKPAKSAGLARLLRAALVLAGQVPPQDLRHFMKKGLEVARTKGIPVARQATPDEFHVLGLEKFDHK